MSRALLVLLLSRPYWPVDIVDFAKAGSIHTHVQVNGYVTYTAREPDGDLHIRLCSNPKVKRMDLTQCIVVECVGKLPCVKPRLKTFVRVQGISRRDPEHGWFEVHPVESITALKGRR